MTGNRAVTAPVRRVGVLLVLLAVPTLTGAVDASAGPPTSVLYVWAGHKGGGVAVPVAARNEYDLPVGRDFLAVVDADDSSPAYGRVVRTVSVPTPPVLGNEAHHVQPYVPPGCSTLLANGLFSDTWFTFDLSVPLRPRLAATVGGTQTIGTAPQFGAVLPNCQAIGTQMGGPLLGSHGSLVRLDSGGARVLEERPAGRVPADRSCASQWDLVLLNPLKVGGPFTRKGERAGCLPANPLGLAVRPDLATVVASDYAEPLRLVLPVPPTSDVGRFTIRHFDLDGACAGAMAPPPTVRCIGEPRVAVLPDGPRRERNEGHEENVGVEGLAATHAAGPHNATGRTPARHLPSRGAFAATSCGGALYYSADITARQPRWREVFDFSAAGEAVRPGSRVPASCVGGGGLVVTPDNRYVVASITGREEGQTTTPIGTATDTRRFPGMIVLLDVAALVGRGANVSCTIDRPDEVWAGGAESDCPRIADIHVVDDPTSGGPHDLALDFSSGGRRFAYFNYFVSETGITGDLRVCILRLEGGRLAPDAAFPAAVDGQRPGTGCISFDRADWPGDRGRRAGPAKPHHGMFYRAR